MKDIKLYCAMENLASTTLQVLHINSTSGISDLTMISQDYTETNLLWYLVQDYNKVNENIS